MSSTDAIIHAAHNLICALQNPAPASPLVTLVNAHKKSLISLEDISEKATSPAVPPTVPVEDAYQYKFQRVNQEENKITNSYESNQSFSPE